MKQLFLPLGLILAIIFTFILPEGGIFLSNHHGLKTLVFIIFLVSGYQTGSKGIALDNKLALLFFTAATISLFLAPLLGLAISRILDFPFHLAMGLIITSTVPPTLSSGVVITEVSHGNGVLALFLTISLNLLGIFTMPFVLDFCLKAAGPVDIDQFALLTKMLFFVLFPFIIGKSIRNMRKTRQIMPHWNTINSSCVILIVYSSLATSKAAFAGLGVAEYMMILAGVAGVHLLLLAITHQAGRILKLKVADSRAMLFVTSQKTLPISLAILASVKFDTGNAIIVCIIFHFFQLFVDSFLAAAMQKTVP